MDENEFEMNEIMKKRRRRRRKKVIVKILNAFDTSSIHANSL